MLNHNRGLIMIFQRLFVSIWKKNSDTADEDWNNGAFLHAFREFVGVYKRLFSPVCPTKKQTTPQMSWPRLQMSESEPIIPELCSVLIILKFAPIILKLCQHNWSKPTHRWLVDSTAIATTASFIIHMASNKKTASEPSSSWVIASFSAFATEWTSVCRLCLEKARALTRCAIY